MGRKELVLINLAPTSSPCLLTGHLVLHLLLVLVLLHLLLLLLSAATRHEHMAHELLDLRNKTQAK